MQVSGMARRKWTKEEIKEYRKIQGAFFTLTRRIPMFLFLKYTELAGQLTGQTQFRGFLFWSLLVLSQCVYFLSESNKHTRLFCNILMLGVQPTK